MVRALGIEPRTPAWKAGVLPLNYARVQRSIQSKSEVFVKMRILSYKVPIPKALQTFL